MTGQESSDLRRGARRRRSAGWILAGIVVWSALISVAHVGVNVGFAEFAEDVRVQLGRTRRSLRVGFLPVT